jgi:hypothetical protein
MRVRCSLAGEVLPDAAAQVGALADVQHAPAAVAEQVDARERGEPVGEVALAALGGADLAGEGPQLLEAVDTEPAEAGDEAVQDVDRRAGVRQGPVVGRRGGAEQPGQRRQLAVRRLVAGEDAAREAGRVDGVVARPGDAEAERSRPSGSRGRRARCGRRAPLRG